MILMWLCVVWIYLQAKTLAGSIASLEKVQASALSKTCFNPAPCAH